MIYKFNEFILENFEQTEYIDFRKTKMEDDFNYLNKLMFDNKVIMPDKLEWFKNKSKLGLCGSLGNIVEYIKISTFYKMTKEQYLDVLAHEMIHAFMTQQGIRDNGHHGRQFTKILNELNRKHPEFNITPTEDASYYTVNNNAKKPIGVILFIDDDVNYSAVFVDKNIINNNDILNQFVEDLNTYIKKFPINIFSRNKSVVLEFYKCDNPELSHFKIKKQLKLTGMKFFNINEGELMKIREGELFNTIKLK